MAGSRPPLLEMQDSDRNFPRHRRRLYDRGPRKGLAQARGRRRIGQRGDTTDRTAFSDHKAKVDGRDAGCRFSLEARTHGASGRGSRRLGRLVRGDSLVPASVHADHEVIGHHLAVFLSGWSLVQRSAVWVELPAAAAHAQRVSRRVLRGGRDASPHGLVHCLRKPKVSAGRARAPGRLAPASIRVRIEVACRYTATEKLNSQKAKTVKQRSLHLR
jgi:hypothetical protein